MKKNESDEEEQITVDPNTIEMTPEGLGKLLFTESQIQFILGEEAFGIGMEIKKGQLLTEAKVRHMVIQQAEAGSSEAQKIVIKWIDNLNFLAIQND